MLKRCTYVPRIVVQLKNFEINVFKDSSQHFQVYIGFLSVCSMDPPSPPNKIGPLFLGVYRVIFSLKMLSFLYKFREILYKPRSNRSYLENIFYLIILATKLHSFQLHGKCIFENVFFKICIMAKPYKNCICIIIISLY